VRVKPAAARVLGRSSVRASAWLRPGRRNDDPEAGMSLVEVVVSLTLITIVMASAGLFFVNNLRTTGGQSQRQEAVFLANRQLESVQALSPSQILTGRSQSSVSALLATSGASALTSQDWTSSGNYDGAAGAGSTAAVPTSQTTTVNSIVYTIRTFINLCSLQSDGSCTAGGSEPSGNAQMYRVTVDVSWTPATNSGCGTGGCDYSASTLIDPHGDPKFNTNISHPTITSVTRNNVGSGSTQTLTISGSSFVAGATVSIDTGAGVFSSVTSNTGTVITVPFTASAAGFYTLAVTNPDGGRATTSLTVNPAPSITSANPASVSGGVQTTVNLAGTGFQTGAGGTITSSAGTTSNASISSTTAATVKLTAPGSGGTVTLTLTNPDGGSDTIDVTVVSAPDVTSISPNSVTTGTTTNLTFTGVNFMGPVTLTPSAGTVNSVTVNSSTQATVNYTAPATGPRSVTWTWRNADGGTENTVPVLTVNPAALNVASVTPAGVVVNSTNKTLTLSGTGFQNGASLSANVGTLSSFVVSSATSATVKYNAPASAQTVTLTWVNPDGGSDTISFLVNAAPTVTNLCVGSVSSCSGGQSTTHNATKTFSIIGTGFQSGATVKMQSAAGTWFNAAGTFVNSTVLRVSATTPNTTGSQSVTVTVTNPDGGVASNTFTVSLT
jgi:type II secretory pathway pseudopilin PulG